MKRFIIIYDFLISFLAMKGQPIISNLSFPNSVNLFQLFEISFKLGPYSNPYDPDTISVYAIFTGPNNNCDSVIGFYYERYTFQKIGGHEVATPDTSPNGTGWRIRFTPNAVGTWYFKIHAIDRHGETVYSNNSTPCSFTCLSVNNAKGFITKANTRYLKRDVVENGLRRHNSFFPIGPNVAWYSCQDYGLWTLPRGFYDYERYIDSLAGNCNYMRIWLTRYQYLNLYGPEYTDTPTTMFFDSTLNQKDAAELDCIVNYAAQNNIALMPCIFTYGDFTYVNSQEPGDPSIWGNNPYNTIIGDPCQFFEDDNAQHIAQNLIRYIIARCGYATNIVSWELWNEVTNMSCDGYKPIEEEILKWHKHVSDYIREIDPFNHCISTSMTKYSYYPSLYSNLYMHLDFVQRHDYQNINKAASNQQFSYILFDLCEKAHYLYSDKPFFIGEFGFGNNSLYNSKDPYGIDLHNSLWSSLFSTSLGPASLWWWNYLDDMGLFARFKPILRFCQSLPLLSDSFEPFTTGNIQGNQLVFDNNLETYFMKNATEDTIYGWSQDTAFAYQSLRWLTDSVIPAGQPHGLHFVDTVVFDPDGYVYTLNPLKRPQPSSNSNTINIPITNKPNGTLYEVHWYDSETGLEYSNSVTYPSVHQNILGEKYLSISFPSNIRNLNTQTIANTFGDAVFAIFQTDHLPGGHNTKER